MISLMPRDKVVTCEMRKFQSFHCPNEKEFSSGWIYGTINLFELIQDIRVIRKPYWKVFQVRIEVKFEGVEEVYITRSMGVDSINRLT